LKKTITIKRRGSTVRPPRRDAEVAKLRARLAEAEETLAAIRGGQVDALVVSAPQGTQVYSLTGAEKPYRLLIEAINEGALTLLQDGTILYCNSRFAQMTGRSLRTIIGSSFFEFLPPDQTDQLRRLLAGLTQKGAKAEFRLRRSAPQPYEMPIQLSVAPLAIDNVKAIGVIATDLTESKRQEQILHHLNEALEQRVLERTAEVTRANQALTQAQAELRQYSEGLEKLVAERTAELQQSVKSLEDFCYSMAHDLRAPLRTMSGFATTLMEDFERVLPPAARDLTRRINSAAERMDELIRDLLAYGRINSTELPLQPVDPLPLLTELVHSPKDKEASIRLEPQFPKVMANRLALEQALGHLLTNAVKFVPPGVRPEIRVFAQEPQAGCVRICVEDNGIGIDPKYHDRIFRVFERVATSQYPGTGIGLAIVQKAVERMGGRVGLDSAEGKGSRFWLELPKAE
jgi:PAS domain S-box-containing protein